MLAATHEIPCSCIGPSEWKRSISKDGTASKETCMHELEQLLQTTFPATLWVGGRETHNKDRRTDASDAACIGLCGVRKQHPMISVATMPINAPFVGAPEDGRGGCGSKRSRDEFEAPGANGTQ